MRKCISFIVLTYVILLTSAQEPQPEPVPYTLEPEPDQPTVPEPSSEGPLPLPPVTVPTTIPEPSPEDQPIYLPLPEPIPDPPVAPLPPLTPFEIWKLCFIPICVIILVSLIVFLKLHPFFALVFVSFLYGVGTGLGVRTVSLITSGMGGTLGGVTIIIVCGTLIGTALVKSGGAMTLADSVLKLFGPQSVPFALSWIGFIVSIPVFCDSGFFLLYPMANSLADKQNIWTKKLCLLSLANGLGTSHTLVPPTPGPLAVAYLLQADLSLVIGFGMLVGVFISMIGTPMALLVEFKLFKPLHDREEDVKATDEEESHVNAEAIPDVDQRPSILACVFCILFPVLLITLASVATLGSQPFGTGTHIDVLLVVGAPPVALFLGAISSLFLLKGFTTKELSESGVFGKSLRDCATIILIIGSSGGFGAVLQATGIASLIGSHLELGNFGIFIPIVLTGLIRVSIGSATVSMITSANIVAPLMEDLGLTSEVDKALAVVGIGIGSMFLTHINDSWFWILMKFIKVPMKVLLIACTGGSFLGSFTGTIIVVIFHYSNIAGGILAAVVFVLYSIFLFTLRFESCWIRRLLADETSVLLGRDKTTYVRT